MIIMVAGAMGAGKTTFCLKYSKENNFVYLKCRMDMEAEINSLPLDGNYIMDGALFKPGDGGYSMTEAVITVPHVIWGLFAPPLVILNRFIRRSGPRPDYNVEKIKLVQSRLINVVDRAIWNCD